MIAPIYIDLSGTVDEFYLDESETKALSRFVLDRIGAEYERNWESQIDANLHQTRTEYRRAIFVEQPDEFSLVFGMTPRKSKLGMMLEEGASSFDIKDGMEKSSKKKITANGGWYITVPFRHATPGAVAESAIFASKLPSEIYKIAKTSTNPLKTHQLPKGYREKRTSSVGYKHKATIYEGLGRDDTSSTGKENRGGYTTFRRISNNSEENSWQHPGFESLNLMEKAMNQTKFDFIMDKAIDDFLTKKFTM